MTDSINFTAPAAHSTNDRPASPICRHNGASRLASCAGQADQESHASAARLSLSRPSHDDETEHLGLDAAGPFATAPGVSMTPGMPDLQELQQLHRPHIAPAPAQQHGDHSVHSAGCARNAPALEGVQALLSPLGRVRVRLGRILSMGMTAAVLACGVISCAPAHAAFAVIDASALSESIRQRVISIEQWARDNINQARQIEELLSGNSIATDTQLLMDRNYAMDSKHSWEKIARIKEQSLSMLYASRSAWEEFGSAQQYLASFQKASAWSRCMQSGSCSFSRVLTELEDSTISQAMEAFEMSQSMNIKLQEQIDEVQALVVESQSSTSQAGTLDALSKINGSAALSMIDLNNQIALLTRLQSHDMARQSNSRLAREGYLREITRNVPKEADRLPLDSFMQHHRN